MLQVFADTLVYSWLRFDPASRWGQTVDFFVYDAIKIILLLFGMIAAVGFLRTFLPQEKVRAWLNRSGGIGYFLASLFGAITPFCSCSSIPLFFSFLRTGIPLGVSFAFLVTSPVINEYLVVLMLGFFGWKITLAYVLSGLVIGTVSGLILGKLGLERYLVEDIVAARQECACPVYANLAARAHFGIGEAWDIVRKLWGWVLAGVAAGALIHNYVPQQAIQALIARTGIFSVPLAVLIGVPMYGSCAAIVPIAVALFQKGIPLGTALAFMMAVAALSLPEAMLLRRAMKPRLIAVFFGITTLAIIFTGYLLNALQKILV